MNNFEDTFDGTTTLNNCTKRSIYNSWNSQRSGVMDSDYSSWASLSCTCAANEYVSSHICVACAAGTTNDAGDDTSGPDTTCDITFCAVNQYVSNNACVACTAGTTNDAGDDASGPDTACDDSSSGDDSSSAGFPLIPLAAGGGALVVLLLAGCLICRCFYRKKSSNDFFFHPNGDDFSTRSSEEMKTQHEKEMDAPRLKSNNSLDDIKLPDGFGIPSSPMVSEYAV